MLYQIHKDSNSTDTVNSVAILKLSQPICLINTPTVQFRVCDTYKAVRKLFSIHHLNLYIYDMFTCYILSPLYIEENSVYYSSMNWEIFSKNIFVAEFSARERDLRKRLNRHRSADGGCAGSRAHACRRARLSVHFQLDLPPPASQTEQRLPFKPAPKMVGCVGLQELLSPFFCPSWWPEDPNPRLAEWPWPTPSGSPTTAGFLLSFLDLKTHVFGHEYIRSFPSNNFPEHLMWSVASIMKWELQGTVTVKTLWLMMSTPHPLLGPRNGQRNPPAFLFWFSKFHQP